MTFVRAACVAAAAVFVGCNGLDSLRDPGEEVGIFFPRMPPAREGPLAPLEGLIVLRNGCLWIDSGHESYLVLWPAGSHPTIENGVIWLIASDGRRLASVGQRVTAVGGELTEVKDAAALAGRTPPRDCQKGRYWRANEIKNARPG